MASIEEALAKAAARSQKSSSKNRGLRPYDVVNKQAEDKSILEKKSENLPGVENPFPSSTSVDSPEEKKTNQANEEANPILGKELPTLLPSEINEPENYRNKEEVPWPKLEIKEDGAQGDTQAKATNLIEIFDDVSKQVDSLGEQQYSLTEGAESAVKIQKEPIDFEYLIEKVTEDNALKAFIERGGEKDIDDYMKEKGWNKVPHSLQKWALKTFKGNDLKGIYYFFYLSIRNESAVISVGYSAIAEALGVDKKVAPRRIIQNLIKKGAITVEVEPSYKTSRKYKLVPMELLLSQDPTFFKKGKSVEQEITRNIDVDVPVLKKYLIKNFGDGEAFRVLPKYKFVLEKYSANEVIELLEYVILNGIWGIKPDKIGNINSLLTSGESPAQTFGKAFRSYKVSKGKVDKSDSLKVAEIESKLLSEQEEENIKFKVEQARQFIFAFGKAEGERKLEELKNKYRADKGVLPYLPVLESMALAHFYDQMTNSKV